MEISFDKVHKNRKEFLKRHENDDHAEIIGRGDILISVPHAVSQVRLGRYKVAEIGSLAVGLQLANGGNFHFICKTKNNNDDANFDLNSFYKDSLRRIINKYAIKYLIDIHGLASYRDCDINLGTHLGKNTASDEGILKDLINKLEVAGFSVSIDQPFMAGSQTIAGAMKNEQDRLWSLQIEINCNITNKRKNFYRMKKLLSVLNNWLESVEEKGRKRSSKLND